jgi:hypothetical protein
MKVIRHENVCAYPRAMLRTLLSKTEKTLVRRMIRENVLTLVCASGNEISRRVPKYEFETVKARPMIFGGHRPPLQFVEQPR